MSDSRADRQGVSVVDGAPAFNACRADLSGGVTAHIDLDAIRHNYELLRRLCAKSRVMAVVKADAYGHGAVAVARALPRADGLAVARLSEALELRASGVTPRILVLGTLLRSDELAACAAMSVDVTVHDLPTLEAVKALPASARLNIWLKLDSGMHRVGLSNDQFGEADRLLRQHPGVGEITHMTHFSSADSDDIVATTDQLARFKAAHAASGAASSVSLANSAALLRLPEAHADWVRPGILLYGGRAIKGQSVAVRPAMRLTAKVVAVREVGPDEGVGYHGLWVTRSQCRIATIGAGYADGYPRHAASGTPVCINGQVARLAGRVSMDFLTIDVSHCGSVETGDEVELWGTTLPASDVADAAGTIDYQLFASLPARVVRRYRPALSAN